MAPTKIAYTKRATTYDDQIKILRLRGAIIEDEDKAKEYLLDIGYYRLGFYLHPFEITYPALKSRRRHDLKPNTKIEDAVALYYFDLDLRNILNRYLSRIEVAIRTTMIYKLSNKYSTNPTWFVDPTVVSSKFIKDLPSKAYNSIKQKDPIKRHHQKYICQYAPAWKTMEYMTLGNLEVSVNRANDMWDEIYAATRLLFSKAPSLRTLIETSTGIVLPVNIANKISLITGIVNFCKKIFAKIAD